MSRSSSRRLLVTAVAATSVALLASACGKSSNQPSAGPAATPAAASSSPAAGASAPSSAASPAGPQYAAGTPLISDGTTTVTIGGAPVTFPTAVSEAAWSQDGNRIAFIDGAGDVATARPDGGDVAVLVKPAQGSKLSSPAWQGGTVLYTELTSAGTHFVRQAHVVGQADHTEFDLYTLVDTETGAATTKDIADTSNPGGMVRRGVGSTLTTIAFQAAGAKGPEIWVHVSDSNSRGGANPAEEVGQGSWPALGPGNEMAFVGTGGGIEVLTWQGKPNAAPTKIADGGGASHLAWTPDGKSVAYSTPGGIMEASVGRPGAASTQLSAKPGVVSFLPSATVRAVPLSGSSPTDLTGASVAISQHMWLTQNGTTPEPAGGGAHGPYGMSVTIVAANDVATAQKEFSWAGLYGPTLLSTSGGDAGGGQGGALDPRLVAEVKRVLGKPNTRDTFNGLDSVYLVGAAGAFPSSADAAFTALGYKPVHVTSAPKGDPAATARPTIAIVDPSDSAALSEAKADGAHVLQLSAGQLAAADAGYLTGQDKGNESPEPQIVAFGDQAFAAVTAMKLQHLGTPTEALGDTHADFLAATAANTLTNALVVLPAASPADTLLAEIDSFRVNSVANTTAVVTVDPAQGITPTLKALLETRAADINELDVIDTGAKLPADLLKQLEALAGGPLGVQTTANQTADALAQAEGGAGTG